MTLYSVMAGAELGAERPGPAFEGGAGAGAAGAAGAAGCAAGGFAAPDWGCAPLAGGGVAVADAVGVVVGCGVADG
jgi:hypothetical protein